MGGVWDIIELDEMVMTSDSSLELKQGFPFSLCVMSPWVLTFAYTFTSLKQNSTV